MGKYFINFSPAVSREAATRMRQEMRRWKVHVRSDKAIDDLARMWNPVLRGWIQYYGRFYKSALYPVFRHFDTTLARWAMRNTRGSGGIADAQYTGSAVSLAVSPGCLPTGICWAYDRRLDDGSRMSGDVHVRFCERPRGRFLRATHPNVYVGSKRAGERVMQTLERFVSTCLRLRVNRDKSAVDRPWKRKFLGYSMTGAAHAEAEGGP